MQPEKQFQEELTHVAEYCHAHQLRVACAESCTGGLLAAALSSAPGSSDWFEGGLVTYRLTAKEKLLGIPMSDLERYGAVSEQTATQMASLTITRTQADIAISTTGLAGPDGDGTQTPVGTLWIGFWLPTSIAKTNNCWAQEFDLQMPRDRFRETAVRLAITHLANNLV